MDELYEKLRKIENQNNSDTDNHYLETVSDIEKKSTSEDPTKRYYTAFPPLSKEISDANFIKNQMSLTWPAGSTHQLNCNNSNNGLAGVKRKPKRRRSQGMTKNKQTFIKKTAATGIGGGGVDRIHGKKDNSSLWDTNFEGSWEMGHDLIREFIIKQNNNRNRSISESDASNFADLHHFVHSDKKKLLLKNNNNLGDLINNNNNNIRSSEDLEECHLIDFNNEIIDQQNENFIEEFSHNSMGEMSDTSVLMFGNNPIRDEGYVTPDTLTSISEITDSSINGACPRRLYERETSIESINEFKAKFNSSVEALWGDGGGGGGGGENGDDQQQLKSNDLNSFWSKYHKHEYKAFEPIEKQQPHELSNSPPMIDALEQFRKNISGGLLFSMLDSPNNKIGSKFENLQQKSNDFIQAGTNITSSIWSSDCGDGAGIWGEKSQDIKLEVSFFFNTFFFC